MRTCSLESQPNPGLQKRWHGQQVEESNFPLCYGLLRTHLEYCDQLWGLQCKKDMDILKQIQRMVMEMIRQPEHLSCEHSTRELRLFSLEKRRLWGNLIISWNHRIAES